ncbi:Card1-like endonuclease domain-containing protein [Acinetobacter guillouiae]|uniref:Card1-like endonuclease domain-containing protein n=1 Tax=Acinetobacter guillouiae TaxID=106649 RepID=UPI003AF7EF02
MKIVFCTTSRQSAANLQPLQSTEIRPDLVLVASTESFDKEGSHLIQEVKAMGLNAKGIKIENETSVKQLSQQFERIVETYFDSELIVNLTGGTKLMALAAYQVFSGYGYRCFYQEFSTGEIIWLDDETRISNHQQTMKLERYLKAYQFDVVQKQKLSDIPKNYQSYIALITQYLNKSYEKNISFISKLNAYASEKKLPKEELQKIQFDYEEEAFLEYLSKETQVFKLKNNTLYFEYQEDQKFVAGAWFEVLTAQALKQVEQIRDLSLSVQIVKSTQRNTAKTYQELDVMAMLLQKLILIECKTVNWKNATSASEAIYKLTALSQIGGLNTQSCFVSLYDLPASAKTRAAENNIYVISGKNILQLTQQLKKWLN